MRIPERVLASLANEKLGTAQITQRGRAATKAVLCATGVL